MPPIPPSSSSTLRFRILQAIRSSRQRPFSKHHQHQHQKQQKQQRRHASSSSSTSSTAEENVHQNPFQRLWNSPIGLKTVHFWAPVMKWALVIAGISDFYRPPDKLSLTQNLALTATGSIWTRWCLIIKPKNYLLAAVNFFLACVGTVQVSRILAWRRSVAGQEDSVKTEVKKVKDEIVDQAKEVVEDVKTVAKKVVD